MKQVQGIWLPDGDSHFERMMRKEPPRGYRGVMVGAYQHFKIAKALSLTCRRWGALDIGAHVGFWSMWLAQEFAEVHAFEPVPEHADCFDRNVRDANVVLHRHAVGSGEGSVGLSPNQENSGKSSVAAGDGVEVRSIDSYGFQDVALIKIDVEGYEPEVLKGAADTIARCSPLVVFEDNGQHARYGFEPPQAVAEWLGLSPVCRLGDDWYYT